MLSVVIPSRDRPEALERCLAALAEQPGELEVIVVRDRGDAAAGPAAARNAGLRAARGEWLAFIDCDCEVMPDWCERVRARCANHPDAVIGGATVNALDRDLYAACHQLLLDHLYERLNGSRGEATFCASNNMVVPAAALRELGGFDTSFRFAAGEDRDLCERWRASGRPLVFAPEIRVCHMHAMSLGSFARKHFQYGRGARRLHRTQPPGFHSPGFYAGLLLSPFRRATRLRALRLFGLVLISQLATAAGYVAELRAPDHVALGGRDEALAAEVQVERGARRAADPEGAPHHLPGGAGG